MKEENDQTPVEETPVTTEEQPNTEEVENPLLQKRITIEYCLLIGVFLIDIGLPYLALFLTSETGIDGIGKALAIGILLRGFKIVFTFFALIVYPIIILVTRKSTYKENTPFDKKKAHVMLIIFPMLFAIPIVFQVPISNLMYYLKYEIGTGATKVEEKNYKTAKEFYDELESRGFIYDSTFNINRMNKKHNFNSSFPNYYYMKPQIIGLETNTYTDTITYNNFVEDYKKDKYPVYVYNTVLYYDVNNTLEYENASRFSEFEYLSSTNYPFYNDYYLEVHFVYVNGDMYAIVGLESSYPVSSSFETNYTSGEFYTKPYQVILTENDKITTFYEGKYYTDGSIKNEGNTFTMKPNKNKASYEELFKVRKVEHLDRPTLDNYGKELIDGVLKKSVKDYELKKGRGSSAETTIHYYEN